MRTVLSAAAIGLLMLAETWHSRRNERALRTRGAVEPPDDVYRWMAVVYPGAFLAMAVEGGVRGAAPIGIASAGTVVFAVAKAVKYLAIATLGDRWSFRVLVLPGAPLIRTGIYGRLRHPNYLALVGEFAGAALLLHAPVTGPLAALAFLSLLRERIAVEERAHARLSGTSCAPPTSRP